MTQRTRSSMPTSRHWREFLKCLTGRRVRFLIIGAHALANLGEPRNTGDLDVFVQPTRKNIERLRDALTDFGFAPSDEIYQLASGNKMIDLGREPHKIQILNEISGVSFQEAWRSRRSARAHGRTLHFLGREAFIKNKRASGRPKDLADIETLTRK